MVVRIPLLVLLILTPLLGAARCQPRAPIKILAPASGLVESCGLRVAFKLKGGFDLDTLEASLNSHPLHPLAVSRRGRAYTIWVDPGTVMALGRAEHRCEGEKDQQEDAHHHDGPPRMGLPCASDEGGGRGDDPPDCHGERD